MREHEINGNSDQYSGREVLGDLSSAKNYNNHILDFIQEHLPTDGLIVDFGAGTGAYAQVLNKSFTVKCVEPDPDLKYEIASLGLECVDLQDLKDCSVAAFYSCNVLEHISDDVASLRTWNQKLKPGGIAVVYVPAFDVLYSKFDERICHYRRYSRAGLSNRLQQAGFNVVKIQYFDPLGFFVALIYKLLINSGDLSSGSIRFFDRVVYPISKVFMPLTKFFLGKNVMAVAVKP